MRRSPVAHSITVFDTSSTYRTLIGAVLASRGWTCTVHERYEDFLRMVEEVGAEAVIVGCGDLPAPEHAIGHLTETLQLPVIALVDDTPMLKSALLWGATLAFAKPFDPDVLILSTHALLSRPISLRTVLSQAVELGALRIHFVNHTVERVGRQQILGPGEWQLFAYLLAHPTHTFTREELAVAAWGPGFGNRSSEIEMYISRLRRKVETNPRHPEIIVTVREHGYRLGMVPVTPETAGEDRMLRGEEQALSALEMGDQWTTLYGELHDLAINLLDSTRDVIRGSTPEAAEEILSLVALPLQAHLRRFERRQSMWSARSSSVCSRACSAANVRKHEGT